jgi:hypothetical protein
MKNINLVSSNILSGRFIEVDYSEYLYITNFTTNVIPISYLYAKYVLVQNVNYNLGSTPNNIYSPSSANYGLQIQYYFTLNLANVTFTGYNFSSRVNPILVTATNPLPPLPV